MEAAIKSAIDFYNKLEKHSETDISVMLNTIKQRCSSPEIDDSVKKSYILLLDQLNWIYYFQLDQDYIDELDQILRSLSIDRRCRLQSWNDKYRFFKDETAMIHTHNIDIRIDMDRLRDRQRDIYYKILFLVKKTYGQHDSKAIAGGGSTSGGQRSNS
jgi:hypothetical protein